MADEQIYDQQQPRSHSQHSESAVHGKSLHGEFGEIRTSNINKTA